MSIIKRSLDTSFALCALVVSSPLFVLTAIGIKLMSPGPVFYGAKRVARDRRRQRHDWRVFRSVRERRRQRAYGGREFTLYKFRTMRVGADAAEPITAWQDPRVFPFGAWLRASKIDELPQLLNVIKGDVALVGPRPESPEVVRSYYTQDDLTTLRVKPGLTSPGTLYYYTHLEAMLVADHAMEVYVHQVLPLKLALDRVYIRHASLFYDIRLVIRTILVIIRRAVGCRQFSDPPELPEADASRARPSALLEA